MAVPIGQEPTKSGSESEIEEYLGAHERKSMLRFITCGSVDDGKSTLIGRLLYESKLILEDHLGIVEEPANQGALAVIDAAAGDEAQERLVLM